MLTVKVNSFSYKKSGIPRDVSGNGGGFVFDCRFIYNPGREELYKNLTGKDKEVSEFLDSIDVMQDFLDNVKSIAVNAVNNYVERGFKSLMISFGCTGGQHRSVYSAEQISKFLKNKYGDTIIVLTEHIEFPELNNN